MEMAEGGEMNSDAIVSAGGARGGDDEPDELEEEEEVAPVEMGEDPWGAKSRVGCGTLPSSPRLSAQRIELVRIVGLALFTQRHCAVKTTVHDSQYCPTHMN